MSSRAEILDFFVVHTFFDVHFRSAEAQLGKPAAKMQGHSFDLFLLFSHPVTRNLIVPHFPTCFSVKKYPILSLSPLSDF